MIWMFAIYLSTLKHQLSLYSDEHKWVHLFTKLRFELHVIITNVQLILIAQDALIDLVTWLKINLRKKCILSSKQSQDEDLHNWDRINKKTHLKWKKSYWLTRFNFSLKTSLHTSSHYSKNLFNITCYTCNWKSHYFTDCKDEKIKLIIKLSFELTFWTWINIESSCSHFQPDLSWVAHIFNLTWLDSTENWVNSTQLVKNSSLTLKELNIEIFPIFCFCIIFLIESHDEKHEDYMIESHEKKS